MPELPEVETTVRGLSPIVHKKIIRIWSDWDKALATADEDRGVISFAPANAQIYLRLLTNREVVGVSRRGKYIVMRLSHGYALVIHQKMTGHLLIGKWRLAHGRWKAALGNSSPLAETVNGYIHFLIEFRDGAMLAFSDVRKFGRLILGSERVIRALPSLRALGPDPFSKDLTPRKLAVRLSERGNAPIKKLLLDQTVVAGIGNIYSDEILFRTKIHPLAPGAYAAGQSALLFRIMKKTLAEGIHRGGASKTNYRKPDGGKGGFMETCLVYGRAGMACFSCKTTIQKIKVAGRSASFCPTCQRI